MHNDLKSIKIDDPNLVKLAIKESEKFFFQGKTFLAAAQFLAINDFKKTIQILIRTNEVYLSYYLAKYFYQPALKEVAYLLAEHAERYFQVDVCLKLLSEDIKDPRIEALFKRRLMNTGLIKKQTKEEDA